ncbi:hypothetical protein BH18ACT2_BH18ACT2_21180 [soil metagenome]
MDSSIDQLAARLARLEAKEAVLAAFNRYLYALDVGYPDELVTGVFTEDAVLEVINFPPGTMNDLTFTGHDEIRPLYVAHTKTAPAIQGGHHATNISVAVADDASSATLTAYFLTAVGTTGFVQGGQYQGEAVPDPDGERWRFRRYRILSGWGWRVASDALRPISEPLPADRATGGGRPARP